MKIVESVDLAMLKSNGHLIRFIKNPTVEEQLTAVKANPMVFKYIRKPHYKTVKLYEFIAKRDGLKIKTYE